MLKFPHIEWNDEKAKKEMEMGQDQQKKRKPASWVERDRDGMGEWSIYMMDVKGGRIGVRNDVK